MIATTVILDGAMGKRFGKKWELYIDSPAEALRMIEANNPGLISWVRNNLNTFEGYKVTCEYHNGVTEIVGEEELIMSGRVKSVRFTPVIAGSGNTAKIIAGVVIIAIASYFTFGAAAFAAGSVGAAVTGAAMSIGVALALGGVVGLLTPQPTMSGSDMQTRTDKTSYYFNGPTNTTMQGVPVSLTYGKCLVGSHPVSVSLTVDEAVA